MTDQEQASYNRVFETNEILIEVETRNLDLIKTTQDRNTRYKEKIQAQAQEILKLKTQLLLKE